MNPSKPTSDIPLIRNINAGKNRQPTQQEVVFLRQHLPTLEDGLRDTQERMKETKNRLEMAWLKLNAMKNEIPHYVFQSWFDQATSLPGGIPASPESPKSPLITKLGWPSKTHHRNNSGSGVGVSISPPSTNLAAKHVHFLGLISTLHVHQSTLRRYESNYKLLKEEMDLVKTLLHPLHGVPSEVLEEIWLYAVEGGEMERRKKSVEQGYHPTPKAWPAPFALAAVCKDWQVLVRSKPRLWKYLVLDLRCQREGYSTLCLMIHERIHQHLGYSQTLPLDITIIGWGDRLRMKLEPVIRPLLRNATAARKLGDGSEGLGRVELVTGGRNDIDAGYTEILDGLPPTKHFALVRVWPLHNQIRVPASFCAQLRRIEAYDAVFHLEGPSTCVTEGALFKMDRGPIHEFLQQNPFLEQLTVDGLGNTHSGGSSSVPIEAMAQLHTLAFRIADLGTYLQRFHSAPVIALPALRKLILIKMPDFLLSNDWRAFVNTNGQRVTEVEVRSITAYAQRQGQTPSYLAHLRILPALKILYLVGDCARHILGAMALQRSSPVLSGVTRIHVRDSKLPKRALQMYGWLGSKPSSPWIWSRVGAKPIQISLERVQVEDTHPLERSFTN